MSELKSRIEEHYSSLRARAESRAERCLSLAMNSEAFRSNHQKLQKARFALIRAEVNDPALVSALQSEVRTLTEERRSLLQSLGLKEADLRPDYSCKKCSDTGFLPDGSACDCYKALVRQYKLEEVGIASVPLHSFEEANESLTPYIPFAYYRKYCDAFPAVPLSTVFSGPTGTGKTFLAGCMADRIEKRGYSVLFLSAFSLNRFFMSCFEAESYRALSILIDSDLLVIDDLGAEPVYKKITIEYLKLLLDERFSRKKPIIVTTNLTDDQIPERYSERISSRLLDQEHLDYNPYFRGRDLRRKQ
ncbi:MAG: ATP-binding protein [Christensenellaceae bacterium]